MKKTKCDECEKFKWSCICGMSLREKLLTVGLSEKATPTKSRGKKIENT